MMGKDVKNIEKTVRKVIILIYLLLFSVFMLSESKWNRDDVIRR